MTAAELIALLQQLPADAVLVVKGDEFTSPALDARIGDDRLIRLLCPSWPGTVDHVAGRILW